MDRTHTRRPPQAWGRWWLCLDPAAVGPIHRPVELALDGFGTVSVVKPLNDEGVPQPRTRHHRATRKWSHGRVSRLLQSGNRGMIRCDVFETHCLLRLGEARWEQLPCCLENGRLEGLEQAQAEAREKPATARARPSAMERAADLRQRVANFCQGLATATPEDRWRFNRWLCSLKAEDRFIMNIFMGIELRDIPECLQNQIRVANCRRAEGLP